MRANDLPKFPNFEKLDISHKNILQTIANNFPSSDFNFVGLFTWDLDNSVLVSELNGNLVILTSDYLTHQKFYSFIGSNKVDETIEILVNFAKQNGHNPKLMLVPESVISNIATRENHDILEDRDNHDYILSVNDLVEFRTNKYRGKKNLLNRFNRTYGENSRALELDLNNKQVIEDINKVLERWKTSRGKGADEVNDEFIAIEKALHNHSLLDVRAFGIYNSNTLIAFTLFEILPNKVAVIHFDKADVAYEGVFEHLKHNFAKHLAKLEVATINYEQDLGIEGLRKAKEAYHPINYIKKYTVTLK